MSDSKELAKKVEELLSVYEAQYPGDSRKKLPALREAAEVYLRLRLPAKAAPLYERTLSILKATEVRPSVERLAALDALATTYVACGRHREGLTTIEEAIATLKAHFPERTADLYSAMNNLGSTHLGLEQYDRAEKVFLECLSLPEAVLAGRKDAIAATHHQLGALYFQKGDYLRAEKSLSLALTLKKELFGESHPQVGITLNNLAAVYTLLGHPNATTMAEEARRMLEKPVSTPRPTTARAARPVSLRCLDAGGRATELLRPLVEDLGRLGFTVERVFTVSESDIYQEGILPPIVTAYLNQADLTATAHLAPFAQSLAATLARFRAAGTSGYEGNQKPTNDAGVFVHWDDDITVRYYFIGDSYNPSALTTIPRTFANVSPRIQRPGHSLSNIVLWRDEHWHWLQPGGGDNRVD
jgi:tetratricopeptide (TPR) repeat protein